MIYIVLRYYYATPNCVLVCTCKFPEMPTHLLDLEVIYSSRYIDLEVIGKHYCTMGGGERKLHVGYLRQLTTTVTAACSTPGLLLSNREKSTDFNTLASPHLPHYINVSYYLQIYIIHAFRAVDHLEI